MFRMGLQTYTQNQWSAVGDTRDKSLRIGHNFNGTIAFLHAANLVGHTASNASEVEYSIGGSAVHLTDFLEWV